MMKTISWAAMATALMIAAPATPVWAQPSASAAQAQQGSADARLKALYDAEWDWRLKEEALNDTVLTFSQLNQVEPAYKYFKAHSDKEKAYRLTTKLAGIYGNQGKQQLEVESYRFLINADPDNVSAPDFQSSIVNA